VKRVWKAVMVLGALVGVGTIGYYVLEDMTLVDALYMTVTTISTVGFGEVLEMLRTNNIPYVEGDATSDSTLLTAGVARARGLATALSGDSDNALVVISAKGLIHICKWSHVHRAVR
jgi:voltage-gated potassium channel Kch